MELKLEGWGLGKLRLKRLWWGGRFFSFGEAPFMGGCFYIYGLVFAFCWMVMRTKTLRAAHGIRGCKWGFPNVMLAGVLMRTAPA